MTNNLKNMKHRFLFLIIPILLGAVFGANKVFAGTATVSWNANTESDLASYKIYYGTSARTGTNPKTCGLCGYSTSINVGKVTTYTFSNLTDGQTYYFSVSAIDTSTNESSFSSEVSKTILTAAITNLKFAVSLEAISNPSGKNFTITIKDPVTGVQKAQFTSAANTGGEISLPTSVTLSSGNYDIYNDTDRYLRVKKASTALASNATVTLPALKAGDLNNDGIVNSLDWSSMNSKWFTSDATTDINQDGVTNTIDFSWLNKNWLLSDN